MSDDADPTSTGRAIPDPGFAEDDGSADPALATALAAFADDKDRYLEVFPALQRSRLLVPMLAVSGDVEVDGAGRTREKSSDMATALVTGRDGRQALKRELATLALPRDNDLARAKTGLIASVTYRRDSQFALASTYGQALVIGLTVDDVNEWPARIRGVSAESARKAAQSLIRKDAVTAYLIPGGGK